MPSTRLKGSSSMTTMLTIDSATGEVVSVVNPIFFYDDFMGAGHLSIPTTVSSGSNWCAKIVKTAGNVTVGALAHAGIIQLATDATPSEWHILRIDATDVTSVKFTVDGNQVCSGTVFPFAATGANAQVQPFFAVTKVSGTSVGMVNLDYAALWQNRAQSRDRSRGLHPAGVAIPAGWTAAGSLHLY